MYCQVKNFILMKSGIADSGLLINDEMIKAAYDTFMYSPIIYNPNQTLKDYRNDNIVEDFYKESCVGYVCSDVVHNIDEGIVTATVFLQAKFSDRKSFDNWLIDYDKESKSFKYRGCELF